MIEVTAADDRGVCYNFGGDCCNFSGGCCNFDGGCCFLPKIKAQNLRIFFQKFKKGIFFLLLADFFTFTINKHFKFYKYVVLLQMSCPTLCKVNFKGEAISVGLPV